MLPDRGFDRDRRVASRVESVSLAEPSRSQTGAAPRQAVGTNLAEEPAMSLAIIRPTAAVVLAWGTSACDIDTKVGSSGSASVGADRDTAEENSEGEENASEDAGTESTTAESPDSPFCAMCVTHEDASPPRYVCDLPALACGVFYTDTPSSWQTFITLPSTAPELDHCADQGYVRRCC